MDDRRQTAETGEPLFTKRMEVNDANGGSSLKHTIPSEAAEILGLSDDDRVEIDIFEDGYIVRPVPGGSDGD